MESLSQMDLIGRSLLEFLHPCDQMEVKDILTRLIGGHCLDLIVYTYKDLSFTSDFLLIFQETKDSRNVKCSSE